MYSVVHEFVVDTLRVKWAACSIFLNDSRQVPCGCKRQGGQRFYTRNFAVLLSFSMLVFSGTLSAAKPNTYKIATFEYPGFVEKRASVDRPGLGVELVRAAFAAVGANVKFVRLSMSRVMLEMDSGKHSMMMGNLWYYPAEISEKLRLIPMLSVSKVAFYNKSHFLPQSDEIYEVLRKHTVVTNFAPATAHVKGIKHRIVRDPASVVDLVMSGREKLGAMPWVALIELIRQNYIDRIDEIQILKKALVRSPAGVAFAVHDPETEAAQVAFSEGLSIIESNGKADEIRSRYYPSREALEEMLAVEAMHNY